MKVKVSKTISYGKPVYKAHSTDHGVVGVGHTLENCLSAAKRWKDCAYMKRDTFEI